MATPIKPLEFKIYRGLKQIARFLDCHPNTVRRLAQKGLIPAYRDESGRWVMSNWDYYKGWRKPKNETPG